ncbi:altronate dehydratase family protein [Jiella sp. MQZ9-1]|uniref:Altronate dehydratase n=1 Tax=Jiella flava TaxID=2816857 RepID=A0A939FWN8_9HYPH|nr:altronate dehydratase family protein [Jiella flava]MBO0662865.1 altronate dehydratase [Jiella flava]MCD2471375.1 altronate dehydratase family protein [Jiella flava]
MNRPEPLVAAAIRLHPDDNVVVARRRIEPETDGAIEGIAPKTAIMRGHKMAVRAIAAGTPALKYGQIIGFATRDIAPGEHVHTENLAVGEFERDYAIGADAAPVDILPPEEQRHFKGYLRPDRRVGTRNYIVVISSVNCSATVSRAIAGHFSARGAMDAYPGVDGVIGLVHGGGCAFNTKAEGYAYLTRTIAGYANHPNVGGVLMVGLGCETNQIPALMAREGLAESDRLHTMTIQALGGTRKTIEAGIAHVEAMMPLVGAARRSDVPASGLTLALECGGSDGYSGISANPGLGYAADLLVRNGGTVILSETPEIYGAEHLLTRRAERPEVAEKLLERIEWWRRYTARNDAEMDNNPSFGNKAGGLTTILEKSLGAVAKCGTTPLRAVYEYAETVRDHGFVFMDTPGYDPVAVTGQVAGGANLVCFTTGRGSVSGFKPAPSLKLATNSEMYRHMSEDMDVDCGTVITGEETIEELGTRIFEKMLAAASGAATASEMLGYGDNEFVPWQLGALM